MRKLWWSLAGSVVLAGCGADAPAGPPLVMTQIKSAQLKIQIDRSRMVTTIVDFTIGTVTRQKDCQAVAPSISAASYRLGGMA